MPVAVEELVDCSMAEAGGVAAGQRAVRRCRARVSMFSRSELVRNCGATSSTTRYWFSWVKMVEIWRWPNASYKRVVDGLHRHAEAAGLFAIDVELERVAVVGEVVVDIGQLAAAGASPASSAARSSASSAESTSDIEYWYSVARHVAVQGDVLHRLQVQRHARNAGDVCCSRGSTSSRLSRSPRSFSTMLSWPWLSVGLIVPAPMKAATPATAGSLRKRLGYGLGALFHLRERDVVVGLHHAGDQAGVLLGQQALRNHDVQEHGQHHRRRSRSAW